MTEQIELSCAPWLSSRSAEWKAKRLKLRPRAGAHIRRRRRRATSKMTHLNTSSSCNPPSRPVVATCDIQTMWRWRNIPSSTPHDISAPRLHEVLPAKLDTFTEASASAKAMNNDCVDKTGVKEEIIHKGVRGRPRRRRRHEHRPHRRTRQRHSSELRDLERRPPALGGPDPHFVHLCRGPPALPHRDDLLLFKNSFAKANPYSIVNDLLHCHPQPSFAVRKRRMSIKLDRTKRRMSTNALTDKSSQQLRAPPNQGHQQPRRRRHPPGRLSSAGPEAHAASSLHWTSAAVFSAADTAHAPAQQQSAASCSQQSPTHRLPAFAASATVAASAATPLATTAATPHLPPPPPPMPPTPLRHPRPRPPSATHRQRRPAPRGYAPRPCSNGCTINADDAHISRSRRRLARNLVNKLVRGASPTPRVTSQERHELARRRHRAPTS